MIDQLIDATSGFETLSFMDAFFGYNQIHIAEEDQKKNEIHHRLRPILLQSHTLRPQKYRYNLSKSSE